MLSIAFKKHQDKKKENNLLTLIIKLSSYRNTIFNQSARIFSLVLFSNII